jgi:dynein heavy chain
MLKFPGLMSNSTIIWFQKWPLDALTEVSAHFLSKLEISASEHAKLQLINAMAFFHDTVHVRCVDYYDRFVEKRTYLSNVLLIYVYIRYRRHNHVTPRSFSSFLQMYRSLYESQRLIYENLLVKMNTGLNKLKEAADSVEILREELSVKEREIDEASHKAVLVRLVIKKPLYQVIFV